MLKSLLGYPDMRLRYIVLLLCVCCLSSPAWAQEDSLRAIIAKGKKDTAEVGTLIRLAKLYWYEIPDSTEKISQRALLLARRIHDKKGEAFSLTNLGVSHYMRSNFQVALDYYLKALNLHEKNEDTRGISASLNNIGEIYRLIDNNEQALKYYLRALALAEKMQNKLYISSITNNLGIVYHEKKDLDKSIKYYMQSLTLKKILHDEAGESTVLVNLSTVYMDKHDYEKARRTTEQALVISLRVKDYQGLAACYNNLSILYKHKKEYSKSIDFANKGLYYAKKVEDNRLAQTAAFTLSDCYAASGDTIRAFTYYKMGDELEDSVMNEEKSRAIEELAMKYEAAQREKDIKLLQKDNVLHNIEGKQSKQQRNTLFVILLLLMVVLMLAIWNLRQKQQMMGTLQAQRDTLDNLNNVKDKLFAIIGHDLRGPLASIKGFVSLLANDQLSPARTKHMAERLNILTTSAMETLDNLLQWSISQAKGEAYTPVKIDIYQLVEYQLLFFREIAEPKRITLYNNVPPETYVIADNDQLHFILRNLIANAVKFTHAFGKIHIYVEKEADMTGIFVKDSGVGISPENIERLFKPNTHFTTIGTAHEKGTGLGLLVCSEFAELNGGVLRVNSEEGKGATFSVTLKSA